MHVTVNCFAAGASIGQIMYFIILYADMELRLNKIGRNSEGVWIKTTTSHRHSLVQEQRAPKTIQVIEIQFSRLPM